MVAESETSTLGLAASEVFFGVLPREISPVLQRIEAGRLATGAEYRGEVNRGHSRRRHRRRPER